MSTSLVKIKVCVRCMSPNIVDVNCRCVVENKYPTIELEFERCDHCGHIQGDPAETEFNINQFKKHANIGG